MPYRKIKQAFENNCISFSFFVWLQLTNAYEIKKKIISPKNNGHSDTI